MQLIDKLELEAAMKSETKKKTRCLYKFIFGNNVANIKIRTVSMKFLEFRLPQEAWNLTKFGKCLKGILNEHRMAYVAFCALIMKTSDYLAHLRYFKNPIQIDDS